MQQNIMVVSSLYSREGNDLARALRTVGEMGHVARPVITAINTAYDKDKDGDELFYIPADVIMGQMERTLQTTPVQAIKLGFLGPAETQDRIAKRLAELRKKRFVPIILNPSMVPAAFDSRALDVQESLKKHLFPVADMLTPTVAEAERLTGHAIRSVDDMERAADELLNHGPKAVLLRNGQFREGQVVDILATPTAQMIFKTPPLVSGSVSDGRNHFGSVMACAIACGMAEGHNFELCIENALSQLKRMYLSEI